MGKRTAYDSDSEYNTKTYTYRQRERGSEGKNEREGTVEIIRGVMTKIKRGIEKER